MITSENEPTPTEDSSSDLLGPIVEEYFAMQRRGVAPNLDAFVAKYPEHSKKLHELLPMADLLDASSPPLGECNSGFESVAAGSRLGDYCLVKVIGRGGMGVVYQAEHVLLGSIVAIKVLPQTMNSTKHRERFLREASAAARMNHPNIVRVFDFGSQGNTLYYVMSLIQGCGLNQWIQNRTTQKDALLGFDSSGSSGSSRKQSTKWNSVAKVGSQAADALAYAHEMGVVHRDIKPGNLMLEGDGTIYVTDFGLAKVASDLGLTGTGDLLGTLRYLPPESFRDEVDHRSDIYSLGLTLYELACGQPAFGGDDRGKLLHDISEGHIRPLRKVTPKIPRDLDKIITKAIDPDPRSRFADAGEMRDDLRRFLAGEPVTARPASIAYRTSRWLSRNKVVASLAGGLIAILAIASVVAGMTASKFETLATAEEQQRIAVEAALEKADQESAARMRVTVRSLIDDAESKTTTGRPGQRIGAIKSLAEAIRLTAVTPELREQIASQRGMPWDLLVRDLATRALVLPDLELIDHWQHPHSDGQPFAFRRDLQRYVMTDYDSYPARASIYDRSGKVVRSIALPREGWVAWYGWCESTNKLAMTLTDGAHARLYVWNITDNILQQIDEPCKALTMHHAVCNRTGEVVLLMPDNEVGVIDLETREVRWSHRFDREIDRVILSSDEERAAFISAESKRFWIIDLQKFDARDVFVDGNVTTVAWHPDGEQIAVASTDGLVVFDLQKNDVVARAKGDVGSLYDLTYSDDGTLLLGSGERRVTKVWQPMLDQEVLRVESDVSSVAGDDGTILFETPDGFEIRKLVSPKVQQVIGMDVHRVSDAGIRRSGKDVVVAHSGGIRVYDRDTVRLKADRRLEQHAPKVAVATDDTLFYHDWQHVFRVTPGQMPTEQDKAVIRLDGGTILDVAVAPAGDRLAVLNNSPPELHVYSTVDFELLAAFSTDSNTNSVRFTQDGQRLLLGVDRPGLARIIDLSKSKQLNAFDSLPLDFIELDDHRWLVNRGGGLRVLEFDDPNRLLVETGTGGLAKWKLPSAAPILLSPDGNTIATETLKPRATLVMRRSDQTPLRLLPGLNRQPESRPLAYSHDGRYLVTERGRSNVAIWDLQALDEQLASFMEFSTAIKE